MARSRDVRDSKSRRNRYVLYAIPLIALLGIGLTFVLYSLPIPDSPAAMNYTFQLLIQINNKESNASRGIAPGNAIGESGGYWSTTQFNAYGVNANHYPIYMDLPTGPTAACTPVCTIHVKSTVIYNYTLGDFFAVWGKPLGENNTIGQPSQGSFAWQMCVGTSQPGSVSNAWGSLPLSPDIQIVLNYYDTANGLPYCGAG